MSGATQLCPECGSPLRPCKCQRGKKRTGWKADVVTDKGTRYGPLFRAVKAMPCWLKAEGYRDRGHEECGPGVQMGMYSRLDGHTAHHVGRYDEEGLLPVCGRAHDLSAGLGGRTTQLAFRAWLDRRGLSLDRLALDYVGRARVDTKD